MKKVKNLWRYYVNCGFPENVFLDFREEIIIENRKKVLATSFIGSIIMIILSIAALFLPSISKVLPLYLLTALLFVIIYVIIRLIGSRNGALVLVCNYAFITMAFLFAIGLDMIQKSATATTVCVFLVAAQLLIVDKPYREFFYFMTVSILFMLESVFIKQPPKASIDVLNAVVFLIVGLYLGYKHNHMVLHNIRNQHLLAKQRDRDTLTNLYNKNALELRAREFLTGENIKASLLLIDVDDFKHVNDTFGHHVGDQLLASIGGVLFSQVRISDLIGRFGGDEFVIFLPKVDDRTMLQIMAKRIIEEVEQIQLDEHREYRPHICIGIAIAPEDGVEYEELFNKADSAMYNIKQNGKNGYGFYIKKD